MVGKRANPVTLLDVEAAESSTSDLSDEMTSIDEEGLEETPEEKKRLKDAENSFEKSLEYSKRMRSTFEQEMADLNAQLMGIEMEQDAMEMCDTSFFDNDQANYYNDYANSLEDKKKKIEQEIERLQDGLMKKKTGTKRVASTRTKARPKTRRVAVKRSPVKAKRRKSTSSGRRAPGSPARSR
jgi:chromosome segregation ATPase